MVHLYTLEYVQPSWRKKSAIGDNIDARMLSEINQRKTNSEQSHLHVKLKKKETES